MLNILLPIETPELLLRKFRPEDGEGLYAYLSDPETVYFEPYGPLTREQACAEPGPGPSPAASWRWNVPAC